MKATEEAAKRRLIYVNKRLHELPSSLWSTFQTNTPFTKPLSRYIIPGLFTKVFIIYVDIINVKFKNYIQNFQLINDRYFFFSTVILCPGTVLLPVHMFNLCGLLALIDVSLLLWAFCVTISKSDYDIKPT